MIHPLADVHSAKIGVGTSIWQFCVILAHAEIGENCNINCHVFVENNVSIGNNVTVKSGVYLWDGIIIGNNVFIGPNVTFTNDKYPRSKSYPENFQRTVIEDYASVGAGAIVLGGTRIGSYALVGAGALVTKDVPSRALVVGSPAVIVGWLNEDGSHMAHEGDHYFDNKGNKWKVSDNKLVGL